MLSHKFAAATLAATKVMTDARPASEKKYVCSSKDLEEVMKSVMADDGPNAVYCTDEHCVYYHRKTKQSRMRRAHDEEDPYRDVPREILKCMMEARKHNASIKPKLVALKTQ
jgi:hypothetical protein